MPFMADCWRALTRDCGAYFLVHIGQENVHHILSALSHLRHVSQATLHIVAEYYCEDVRLYLLSQSGNVVVFTRMCVHTNVAVPVVCCAVGEALD